MGRSETRRRRGGTARAGALILASGLAVAGGVADAAGDETPAPGVPLEDLFRLPPSAPVEGGVARRGGSTRAQWQSRFEAARKDLESASEDLAAARAALEDSAPESSWRMSAPGLGGQQANPQGDTPHDYRLHQELRRAREEAERAERLLKELEIEANLAGVPENWRRYEEDDSGG